MEATFCYIDKTPNPPRLVRAALLCFAWTNMLALPLTGMAGLTEKSVTCPALDSATQSSATVPRPAPEPSPFPGDAAIDVFPLRYDLPDQGNGSLQSDGLSFEVAQARPAVSRAATRRGADGVDGPVLIPALPAWVVGGLSMLLFAPLMKSRRLRRKILR
jgi:hypothetical protein